MLTTHKVKGFGLDLKYIIEDLMLMWEGGVDKVGKSILSSRDSNLEEADKDVSVVQNKRKCHVHAMYTVSVTKILCTSSIRGWGGPASEEPFSISRLYHLYLLPFLAFTSLSFIPVSYYLHRVPLDSTCGRSVSKRGSGAD